MSRSLKYEIPGTDWRRSLLDLSEQGVQGIFAPELEPHCDVVLEVGFGRGEFLLDLAAKDPNTGFIGIEVSYKRVLKMARKVARAGLTNVRLFECRAQVVMKELVDDASLREIWVNFSDPWPKDRHAGRRVLQPEFVAGAARSLVSGGVLHVATDDVPYAHQIADVLAGEPLLENLSDSGPWLSEVPGRTETGYESDWRAAGRALHFFEYRRVPRPERGASCAS
jgi:tRNA (guanine-N7-)-methyltransferase